MEGIVIKIQKSPRRSRRPTACGNGPEASTPAEEQIPSFSGPPAQDVQQAATDIVHGLASQRQTAIALRPRGSLVSLATFSPFRPLDHAWQVLLRWDEIHHFRPAWTAELPPGARAFVKDLRQCRWLDDHRALKATMPHFYEAFSLSVGRSPELRWQVEARILARQGWDAIAAKTGLAAESLRHFECLFFHVTDRLDDKGFVLDQVIGWHEGGASRLGAVWQYYAYRGGPDVLDTFLYGYPSSRDPQTLNAVREFLVQDGIDDLLLGRMVRARFGLEPANAGPAAQRRLMQFLRRELKRPATMKFRDHDSRNRGN
jgi:hypothetical protein